uniref:Uncharacterized protein n=1 Tax=Anguilla anguilla TaxID=7936 RepID=A0A0E9QQF2_ANGAN
MKSIFVESPMVNHIVYMILKCMR